MVVTFSPMVREVHRACWPTSSRMVRELVAAGRSSFTVRLGESASGAPVRLAVVERTAPSQSCGGYGRIRNYLR